MFLKEILSAGERGDAWVPASLLPQLLRQDTQVGKDKGWGSGYKEKGG